MFRTKAGHLQEQMHNILGLELSSPQIDQFCLYGDLLLEWNQKMNLTSITEPEEIILKHFVDSLTLGKLAQAGRLADIGTGAGFPGIPLKILNPDLELYLVDSLAKRLEFLKVVKTELKLNDVATVHARAEDMGRDARYRASFDIVTSRAVARLPVLLEYAMPLLKVGGQFLAAKGLRVEEEVVEAGRALELLGCEVVRVENYTLGEGAEHRATVIVKKLRTTSKEYPRRAGTPAKTPLL